MLREDREKLRLLQKSQPRFTEEQKKELIDVHPWIKKGSLPKVLDVKVEGHFYAFCSNWNMCFRGKTTTRNVHVSILCFISFAIKQVKVCYL